VVDTCGTGGDVRGTFNISTAAALIAAGAGVKVAKHGNRSVSSHSGSADVMKELGAHIEAPPAVVERCLREANIGFLFAPMLHPAMKYAIGPRRDLGIRTLFNILGPLTNPAAAPCQVLGVYEDKLTGVMARVLRMLGSKHCFVVHASDGLDEISTTGPTHVAELADGVVADYQIRPEDFGLSCCQMGELVVTSVQESAAAVRSVLAGERGPRRDIALLNAAAALAAAGAAEDVARGLKLAARSVDSGAARRALELLVRISNEGRS
jgi:anthranilate phosphoribosyltransferase